MLTLYNPHIQINSHTYIAFNLFCSPETMENQSEHSDSTNPISPFIRPSNSNLDSISSVGVTNSFPFADYSTQSYQNFDRDVQQNKSQQFQLLFTQHGSCVDADRSRNKLFLQQKESTTIQILKDVKTVESMFSREKQSKETSFPSPTDQGTSKEVKGPVFTLKSQQRYLGFEYTIFNINIFNQLKQQYRQQEKKALKAVSGDKKPKKPTFRWKTIELATTTNLSIFRDFLKTSQWIERPRNQIRIWASLISRDKFQQFLVEQIKKDSKQIDSNKFILLDRIHPWYTITHLMTKFEKLFFVIQLACNEKFMFKVTEKQCKNCKSNKIRQCICLQSYFCFSCNQKTEEQIHNVKCKYMKHQQFKCEPMCLRQQARLGLVGLKNPNNVCFFNTALQCLLAVEHLTMYFLSKQYFRQLNPGNHMGSFGQITCQYAAFINEAICQEKAVINPKRLRNTLARFYNEFIDIEESQEQQDSHECLSLLLNYMREDLNTAPIKRHEYYEESSDGMVDQGGPKRFWEEIFSRNSSIIDELFTIIIRSTIECSKCSVKSTRYETSLELPLPVLPPTKKQVQQQPISTFGLFYFSNQFSHKNKYITLYLDRYTLAEIEQQTRRILSLKFQTLAFYILSKHEGINRITQNNLHQLLQSIKPGERELCCLQVDQEDLAASKFQIILTFQQQNEKLGIYENVSLKRPLFFQRFKRPDRGEQIYRKILRYLFKRVFLHKDMEEQVYIQKYIKDCPFKVFISNDLTDRKFIEIGLEDQIRLSLNATQIVARFEDTSIFKLKNLALTQRIKTRPILRLKSQTTKTVVQNASVIDCINKFRQPEIIAGWKCPKCKSSNGASKTQSIYQTSKVLIVYFKRFRSLLVNGKIKQEKINHHIEFPQILDLSQVVDVPDSLVSSSTTQSQPTVEYRLKAVANHYEKQQGALESGHYIAYIQNKHNWFVCNDEMIGILNSGNICSKNAYYLIYERIE